MALWKIALVTIISCLQLCQSSYLGYPRIHFAGQFRADSDTRNNDPCNYDPDFPLNPDTNGADWGFNGTNEVQFFETQVTSVIYNTGESSTADSVVGRGIVGNLERPFAKLTDLDVDCQDHSTIYGLNFGIRLSDDQPTSPSDLAFYGKWTPSVVAQSMWRRLKCYSDTNHGPELYQDSFPLGAQSTTKITNMNWGDVSQSQALQELQTAAGGGDLVVRISFFYYTRNYPAYVPFNATLGYVVGVIGVPSADDTLNVPGSRLMFANNNVPQVTYSDPNDLCYQQDLSDPNYLKWMNYAPFEVDSSNNQVRFDLSNAVPSTLNNDIRNIGELRLGILMNDPVCVHLLSDSGIPYDTTDLDINSGIFTVSVDASLMDEIAGNPVVIAQYLNGDSGSDTQICGESLGSGSHTVRILLQEPEYFVRPQNYYVDRLEKNYNPSSSQVLYVTRYGVPASSVGVQVSRVNEDIIPLNGVTPTSFTGTTDSTGKVTFEFNVDATISGDRQYKSPGVKCYDGTYLTSIPIDGQIYYFTYCVNSANGQTVECTNSDFTIVFLAFSEISNTSPYNWLDDISPILSQYARLTPIMKTILDMSSYADVTQNHNIELLKLTLNLCLGNPSYMPTTRDLSTAKKNMILEWLENPIYDSSSSNPPDEIPVCIPPDTSAAIPTVRTVTPRCESSAIPFTQHPMILEPYFELISTESRRIGVNFAKGGKMKIKGRPLLGRIHKKNKNLRSMQLLKSMDEPTCTRDNVVAQLQTAVQLEWGTIPAYLTSLYSIVDGCNTEIYNIIRSVVMQEMLHFTQSSNILIAMRETPLIDDASVTPNYPTNLPGGVLPNLIVNLEKLSLEHVHQVFMGIEVPQKTDVAGTIDTDLFTIGVFYAEVADCITELGDSIFDASTLPQQVQWPWNASTTVGDVVPVTDAASANAAIDMIVAQGEGEGLMDPYDIGNYTLAHFFKFEEIVCQHHLEQVSQDTYAYSGDPIPFTAAGVWPMRDNPSITGILPHTNCYTESRVFHEAYRALLYKLQEVFSGNPDKIEQAITIMESLQVHAKKLMWTKYRPSNDADDTTCGPVWEYDWPIN